MLKRLMANLLAAKTGALEEDSLSAAETHALGLEIEHAAACSARGDHAGAVAQYRRCLEIEMQDARIWCNFGAELHASGDSTEAEYAYCRALELDPELAQASYNLGALLQERGSLAEAKQCYHAALARVNPVDERELWLTLRGNLGLLLQNQGRQQEALDSYRQWLAQEPLAHGLRSNMLFVLTAMSNRPAEELLAEHREFGRLLEHAHAPHPNVPDAERRLRIGYVSADFYSHPLAFFFLPLLVHRERAFAEIVCYSNGENRDQITARLQQSADRWRDIRSLDDAAAEAAIRADGIDILVDLSGHTAGNRLPLFARKPAPLQLTYLGYANTTGLTAMDYRLTDAYTDPAGTEGCYVEKLLRMPASLWCYEPLRQAPPPTPAPVRERGYVTFASFNSAYKLNPPLLKVWAAILRALPDSRLLLVNVPAGEARERILAAFAHEGIAGARLETHPRLATDDFWAAHARADIALDPFPCNGGATTCETLWLGVPVVTLAGTSFVGRAGASLLANGGFPELIARTSEEYVGLAVGLARDPARLAALRTALRERLPASPLMDAPRYVRALEAHYRDIWRKWCAERAHA